MSVDLKTRYLNLELSNPLVVSACTLTGKVETLVRLEEAGAAAVVLPSLFEEQIEHEELELHEAFEQGAHSFSEALTYLPDIEDLATGPSSYLDHLAAAKEALRIPVIASLNGSSKGGWLRYARLAEEAGADALELNVYAVEADAATEGHHVEHSLLELVRAVRAAVSIPLAVKVGPYYTAFANVARRLAESGADGVVCFNRFLGPDIDLDTLTVQAGVRLSTPDELRLPLRWIAILRGRVALDLAATGGAHTSEDVVKLVLAGADVVMLASSLLRNGPGHVTSVVGGLARWLAEHEYASVDQARGSLSQVACPDPAAFERAQYMRALTTYSARQRA
ncbi:MAG: dihydroorotate dehydrogenase-like protein [Syntrophothermus sp.]